MAACQHGIQWPLPRQIRRSSAGQRHNLLYFVLNTHSVSFRIILFRLQPPPPLPILFLLSFSPKVVAYLHEWTDDRGGAFVYWKDNSGKMHSVPPSPLSGSSVDGSKTVHAGVFARHFARITVRICLLEGQQRQDAQRSSQPPIRLLSRRI